MTKNAIQISNDSSWQQVLISVLTVTRTTIKGPSRHRIVIIPVIDAIAFGASSLHYLG